MLIGTMGPNLIWKRKGLIITQTAKMHLSCQVKGQRHLVRSKSFTVNSHSRCGAQWQVRGQQANNTPPEEIVNKTMYSILHVCSLY